MSSNFQDLDDFWPIKLSWSPFKVLFKSDIHHLCWRFFIFSIDDCNGTGDHENYFKDITDAYEFDGTEYANCRKKFVSYRSRSEHKRVSKLIENDFFFHHPETGYFLFLFQQKLRDYKEVFDPKFSWVVINLFF